MTCNTEMTDDGGHVFDSPVADIDIKALIETGRPIILTTPKNLSAETREALGKLKHQLIGQGAKVVEVGADH
jgi:hypothetical protein